MNYWSILIVSCVILGVPTIVGSVIETTHKGNTLAFSAILLLLVFHHNQNISSRMIFLILIFGTAISITNMVFGMAIFVCLMVYVLHNAVVDYWLYNNKQSWRLQFTPLLIIPFSAYTSTVYTTDLGSSGALLRMVSLYTSIYNALFSEGSDSSTEEGTSVFAEIAAWPSIEFAGFSVNSWVLFSIGELTVAAIVIFAFVHSVRQYLNGEFGVNNLLITVCVYYGFVVVALAATGNVETGKRFVKVPTIVGVPIGLYHLSTIKSKVLKNILPVLIVILIILSMLSVPLGSERVISDGGEKPIDNYMNQQEMASIIWAGELERQNLTSDEPKVRYLSSLLNRDLIPERDITEKHNRVYNSGEKGIKLYYDSI